MEPERLPEVAKIFIEKYKDVYPSVGRNEGKILTELALEVERFSKTLENGLKELEKVLKFVQGGVLPGKTAFRLYDTFGFPLEMTEELAKERGFAVNLEEYKLAEAKHKEASGAGADQKFKGGLADDGNATTNLHTATHIMLRALKTVLGEEVDQKGSNITPERLRFDFNFPRPLTAEEIKKVEDLVNGVIKKDLQVSAQEMTVQEAKAKGAVGVFETRYGERVKVYCVGDFDLQICGGPHAQSTGKLGKFKILKEQSSSAGIRRIKAVL
jgi:alanyl-tRNA synthetase